MASGHEYRTNRPNTWLLRPRCKVKILLANPEPSTHGPKRALRILAAVEIDVTQCSPPELQAERRKA